MNIDPFSGLCKIINILFYNNAKLIFRDNDIILIESHSIVNNLSRFMYGDSRNDLWNINHIINNFINVYINNNNCNYYNNIFINEYNVEYKTIIKSIMNFAIMAFVKLQKTYNTDGIIILVLQNFINLLRSIINEIFSNDMMYNTDIVYKNKYFWNYSEINNIYLLYNKHIKCVHYNTNSQENILNEINEIINAQLDKGISFIN